MNVHPLHTEADYRSALREVSAYFNDEPKRGTTRSNSPILSKLSNFAWIKPAFHLRISCQQSDGSTESTRS